MRTNIFSRHDINSSTTTRSSERMGVSRGTFKFTRKGDLPLMTQGFDQLYFAIPAREIACLDARHTHPDIKDSAYIEPFKKDDSLIVADGGGHLHGREQRAWQIPETITYFRGESVLSASTWKNLGLGKISMPIYKQFTLIFSAT